MSQLRIFVFIFLFLSGSSSSRYSGSSCQCRCLPTDPSCWPPTEEWSSLNRTLAGRLLVPRPYAWQCHDPDYDQSACDEARQLRQNSFHRSSEVGAMQFTDWETDLSSGLGCNIGNSSNSDSVRSTPCYQGSVPAYAINVSRIEHVQAGVRFAARHKLRLVVKSTGHDWKGRSTAPGSLSIWLYHLKGVTIHESFISQGCQHEAEHAATAESGVQWRLLYDRVGASGRVIVGGMASSVSAAGGYVQGGGHSPLSRTYGLAADNVLEFTVVTADGRVRVANKCQNQDLFFALSGGGGSTYGVVWSATFRTFPALKSIAHTTYVAASLDAASHRNLTRKFVGIGPQMDRAGLAGYFYIFPSYILLSFLLPNGSEASARAAFEPLTSYVKQEPGLLTVNHSVVVYDNFVDWHEGVLCQANPGVCTDATGFVRRLATRFIPKSLIAESPSLVADTILQMLDRGFSAVVGLFVVGGEVSNLAGKNNSVAGFWREALWHLSISVTWTENTSLQIQQERQRYLTETNQLLRNITPGSGCYMNEADYNEPDWQYSFFGNKYPMLDRIKASVDPGSLFLCHHCVGSEKQCYKDWDSTSL